MKTWMILPALLLTGSMLKAQTFNEHESIGEQLKKGMAPGLQFAPVRSEAKPDNITGIQKKESLITQIRKGTAAGMKFQPVGAGARTATAQPAPVAKQGPLASELEKPKEVPKVNKQELPTQEEKPVAPAGS